MSALLTSEQKTALIDTCNVMINRDVTSDYSANLREVAKIALSALTVVDIANRGAQPVAWTDAQELRDAERDGWGYLFKTNPITPHADPRRVIKLYIAPPAPAVLTDEQIDAVLDSHGNMAYVIADKRERLRMFAREILRAAMLANPQPVAVQSHECASRKTFPWVEGAVIPVWVRSLASGVQGCESVYIVAELDSDKQSQGWPQFIAAYIDIRLNRYICGNTAENVSDHVLRYLPFDHSEVEAHHAE